MAGAKKKYTYDYPRPAVTVDLVVVTEEARPRVLLIRRGHDPFAGAWAIPGGVGDRDGSPEAAGRRELLEETGVRVGEVEQLGAFGDPQRDPRGRTISIAFLAQVDVPPASAQAGDDAADLAWHFFDALPPLAF